MRNWVFFTPPTDSPATVGLSGFFKILHGTVWLPKTGPLHSENPTVRSPFQQPINRLCSRTGEKVPRVVNLARACCDVGHVVIPLRFCVLGSGVGVLVLVMKPYFRGGANPILPPQFPCGTVIPEGGSQTHQRRQTD